MNPLPYRPPFVNGSVSSNCKLEVGILAAVLRYDDGDFPTLLESLNWIEFHINVFVDCGQSSLARDGAS